MVFLRNIAARFALPKGITPFGSSCTRVFGCVFVAILAMGCSQASSGSQGSSLIAYSDATFNIDGAGDGFQVLGVDTAANPAQMIQLQSRRYFSDVELVGNTVSKRWYAVPTLPNVQASISLAIESSEPEPASGGWFGRNLLMEAICDGSRGHRHSSIIPEFYMAQLGLRLGFVMDSFRRSGFAVSLCSIQAPDGLYGASGAPSNTYVAVTGLQAIKCMDAPDNFGASVSAGEQRAVSEIESKALRHVLLDRNYTQLSPSTNWGDIGWRAVLTNTVSGQVQTYDIKGAEADSQSLMTRLCLQAVTL